MRSVELWGTELGVELAGALFPARKDAETVFLQVVSVLFDFRQQVVHRQPLDIGALLPVPHWFEREAAPYITAGVIVAKDPETGLKTCE